MKNVLSHIVVSLSTLIIFILLLGSMIGATQGRELKYFGKCAPGESIASYNPGYILGCYSTQPFSKWGIDK